LNDIQGRETPAFRKDMVVVLAAAAVALTIYFLTMACSVSFWDSGEFISCSWIMGIPHPPGTPMFELLGRVATLLFFFIPSVAVRTNLMCVLAGTVSVAILARLIQRWCMRLGTEPSFYRPVSIAGALMSAFSYTIWQNNNATETYAVSQLIAIFSLWIFDIWIERNSQGKPADRLLFLILYLLMLGVGVHLAALTVVPGIAVIYILRAVRRRTRLWADARSIFTALGLMTIAFSAHLYMPVRAIQRPAINETDPSRWTAFRDALARKQYGSMMFIHRKGPIDQQFVQYARYLSWQTGTPEAWSRALGGAGLPVAGALRFALSAAAIWGAIVMSKRRKDVLLLVGAIFLMASIFFILYLNFKTGPVGTSIGEVRERDYFYADSFSFFAVFAAIGAGFALKSLWNRNSAAWGLLVLPSVSAAINFYECDRSRDMVAHDYGVNLLESCSPGAVLITNGDNDTFPLWFAQNVLGVRQDVIVSNLSLMNTDWYVYQLLDRDPDLVSFGGLGLVDSLRPVFVWGPHFFDVTDSGMPRLSAVDDSLLRSVFDQPWPWAIRRGTLAIAVPSEARGIQGSLGMQDLVLLSMIQRQPIHGRDIYLAGTVATDNRVYLDDYLSMEGIAFRVLDHPVVDAVAEDRGTLLLDGYGYSGLYDPSIFKDDQTAQLARNYVSAYHRIAYSALYRGDAEALRHALDRAHEIFAGMPESWITILPSQAMLEARLVDGLEGSAAAAETLQARAALLSEVADQPGNSRLASTAVAMQQVATDYVRENQFQSFAESLAVDSEAARWLSIEVDIGFGNYIAAWREIDAWSAELPGSRLASLSREQLEAFFQKTPIDGRYDLTSGGMAAVLTFTEGDSLGCAALIRHLISLTAESRTMEAVSAGTVLASEMRNSRESDLVLGYVESIAADPALAQSRAAWFVREERRSSLEALAWQCANLGDAPLCLAALSASQAEGAESGALRLVSSPSAYMAALPLPGRGSGDYGWVSALGVAP
jgi:hypothetical protein